jgi:hypothetical protein
MRRALPLAAALALAAPALAAGLEPRFDHRDEHGPAAELTYAYDAVAISGRATQSGWRPALRLAWSFDAFGEGNDLFLGVQAALRSWSDPEREHVNLALDGRYRGYFGSEELKTFFDLGVWVPVVSRLAIGPLAGIGLAYDFSRSGGVYAAGTFSTAFGEARIASFGVSIGAQLRFQ